MSNLIASNQSPNPNRVSNLERGTPRITEDGSEGAVVVDRDAPHFNLTAGKNMEDAKFLQFMEQGRPKKLSEKCERSMNNLSHNPF